MWRPDRLGLAALVPALVILAVVTTAAAAVFLALYLGRGLLEEEALHNMERDADSYAAAVRFYLEGAQAAVETTAAAPPVAAALVAVARDAPGGPVREEALAGARLLASLLLRHSRVFHYVLLLDSAGRIVLLEPGELEKANVRPDRAHAAWFRDAIRGGRTVISDLHLSLATREPAVVVASPVRDAAGRVLGLWAGTLRLAELSRVGLADPKASGPRGFVTDRRGLIVAHQGEPRYVQYQTDFGGVPAVQAALKGRRAAGRFADPVERVEQMGAWVPLPATGWAVVYATPARAALAPIRAWSLSLLSAAAAIALLLGLAGVLLARRVVRPLRQLTRAAERVGPELPRFEVDIAAETEAARLARALNGMVQAIADRDTALEARTRELEAAVEQLEAASRAKDEFLATLSHELRTPLNAVYGWARVLQEGEVDAQTTRRALAVIERNAAAQTQLIDDLLDVSRIVTGQMRLDVQTVELPRVIDDALDAVRPAAEAKGIRLQAVLDPRAGPVVGDAERLRQVVWNLLVNAVKFTPRGGRVQVHLERVDSNVELAVSDTGEGIAADVLPHVFERFRQADSGPTRAHGGLGIGLALVRHLVELHGGSVRAHSDGPGKGARFVVSLPVPAAMLPAAAAARDRLDPATGVRPPALTGLCVLVVDDAAESLELMGTVLRGQGALVVTCASAAAAMAALAAHRPDVLLSDVEMPREDGYALIRRVRALPAAQGGNVPAAAITAYGRTEDRVRALSAGFTTHVPKPVDPVELVAVVATLARQGGIARG